MKHKITLGTTALEILQKKATVPEASSTMTELMDMVVVEAEKGYVKFKAVANQNHLNMMGKVHGGFYATLLDAAMGCATHTILEADEVYATLEISIKMIKFIELGQEVYIDARVISVSNKITVVESKMYNMNGEHHAHGASTCYLKRRS